MISRLTFAFASRVTAVSETYLAWAMQRGRRKDRASFAVYYLGARNNAFEVGVVPDAKNSISCLFAGQFGFSYDVELILSAAERLQDTGQHDIRFVLCGAGDKQREVTRRAGALSNVELHGWLSPEELNSIGARCQVGLCCYRPTATQSIPTKLFDYLSMGLYVVSSLAGDAEALLTAHAVGRNYTAGSVDSFIECLRRTRCEENLGPAERSTIRSTFDQNFNSTVIYERMVEEIILPMAANGRASKGSP
jgi:glycosyltransferase involved in cell wall biosynthesis